ncbi:MAG TPA: peptidase E [Frankiaceae bacterium]|nr:peptidase E [Frankiaceae bacterium]
MTSRIVAIGGGGLAERDGRRPMLEFVLGLTGKDRPNVCYVGTAMGDDARYTTMFYDVAREVGFAGNHLDLFPMPNVTDVRAHLLAQDAIYVGGGSVANLLAVWRTHALDVYLREAWENGVVLAGTSAGSICWFEGGTTDSFGRDPLMPVTNGLAFVAASNSPHYDSEERRRPLYQRLVANGTLSPGWAADDGVGLVFEGTGLAEAVTYRDDAAAWRVERDGETRVAPRRL